MKFEFEIPDDAIQGAINRLIVGEAQGFIRTNDKQIQEKIGKALDHGLEVILKEELAKSDRLRAVDVEEIDRKLKANTRKVFGENA